MNDGARKAGTEHLASGEQALSRGEWADAREAFGAALEAFASPDQLLGRGHALRGLSSSALGEGDPEQAEAQLEQAIGCYRTLRAQLDEQDDAGVAAPLRLDAMEAEASAQVQLGELLLRSGRVDEAEEARDWASAAYRGVGARPSACALHDLSARIALRAGDLEQAEIAWRQMLALHERFDDERGRAVAWSGLAEVRRLAGDLDGSRDACQAAMQRARAVGDRRLEIRSLAGLGQLAIQTGDLESALLAYEQVLRSADELDDDELRGFADLNLGDILSRLGRPNPITHLRRALGALHDVGAEHAVGAALHHAADHALRLGHPDLGLALAEGARRIWRGVDPLRGVALALRLQVKCLAALGVPDDTLVTVASLRERLAGGSQPSAAAVAAYYAERAAPDVVDELGRLPLGEHEAVVEQTLGDALEAVLSSVQLARSELASATAGQALLDRLSARGDARDLDELTASDLQPLPVDDAFYVLMESDLLPPGGAA